MATKELKLRKNHLVVTKELKLRKAPRRTKAFAAFFVQHSRLRYVLKVLIKRPNWDSIEITIEFNAL